jgi:hypothetical protein
MIGLGRGVRLNSSRKDWREKRAATLMDVLLDATSPSAWRLSKRWQQRIANVQVVKQRSPIQVLDQFLKGLNMVASLQK